MTTEPSIVTEVSAPSQTEQQTGRGLMRSLSGLNLRRRLSFSGLKDLVNGNSVPSKESMVTDSSMAEASMNKSTKRSVRRTKSSDSTTNERRRARRRNQEGTSTEGRPRRSRSKLSLRRNYSTSSEDSTLAQIDAMTSELEQMAKLLSKVEDPGKIITTHIKVGNTAA